jgi:hypothetical protein
MDGSTRQPREVYEPKWLNGYTVGLYRQTNIFVCTRPQLRRYKYTSACLPVYTVIVGMFFNDLHQNASHILLLYRHLPINV